MRIGLALLFSFLSGPALGQLAVTDPGVTAVQQAQLKMMTLHDQFMKTQMVRDAVVLKDNYLQTKQYYDMVYERSLHRGGLMGYYKDYFDQQVSNLAGEEWRRMNSEGSSISSGTMINQMAARVTNAFGDASKAGINLAGNAAMAPIRTLDGAYSNVRGDIFASQQRQVAAADGVIAGSEKRADATTQQIQDLVRRGSSLAISDKERDSIDMHSGLLQLQLLSEMRHLLNVNAQILNAQARANLNEATLALQASNGLAIYRERAGQARVNNSPTQNDIVRELKRRPGE